MKRHAIHGWSADPTNLLIISPTAGGKTYLACAIGVAACLTEHSVHYARMDDLARQLVIARGDAIGHQNMLNKLSDVDLLIIDDFRTAGIDPNAASDLFTILANRDYRLPTIIVSQSVPAYWVETLPDRMAADSTVTRRATTIGSGDKTYWPGIAHRNPRPVPTHWKSGTNNVVTGTKQSYPPNGVLELRHQTLGHYSSS